jgi:hypothetical protein
MILDLFASFIESICRNDVSNTIGPATFDIEQNI